MNSTFSNFVVFIWHSIVLINALWSFFNKKSWLMNMMCPWLFMLFLLSNVFYFDKKWKKNFFFLYFHLYFDKKYNFFAFDWLKFILQANCGVYEIPWPLKHIIRHQKQSSRFISSFFIAFCIILRQKWRPSWICQSCELKGGLQPVFLLIFLKDT